MSETTLWTNQSPTSNLANDTTITLSDNMTNYKYLKIKYRKSTTIADENSVMLDVADFKANCGYTDRVANRSFYLAFGSWARSSSSVRVFFYVSDTEINFDRAYSPGATGSNYTSEQIPVEIIGMK